MCRHKFTDALPERVLEPRLLLERRIDLEEAIIDGFLLRIEYHLDHTEAFVDGIEQHPITLVAFARVRLRLLLLGDVPNDSGHANLTGFGIARGYRALFEPRDFPVAR